MGTYVRQMAVTSTIYDCSSSANFPAIGNAGSGRNEPCRYPPCNPPSTAVIIWPTGSVAAERVRAFPIDSTLRDRDKNVMPVKASCFRGGCARLIGHRRRGHAHLWCIWFLTGETTR